MVRAKTVPLWVPANSEIVIEGWVSTECGMIGWHPDSGEPLGPGAVFEGPFGDHTGFYSLPDRYPVVEVTALTHRHDAIYPTTLVGLPPQEDYYLGKTTERVFLPLLRTIVHDIEDYHLPMFGCFHNAAFVRIRKAYPLQARRVMSSVWGAGQLAWTKMVFVFDGDAPIHDEAAAMRHVFRSCDFLRDVVTVDGPLDILDHSAPWIGAGTKLGFDCTAKLEGEARNGVPLGTIALPADAEVEDARQALARIAGPGSRVTFPPEGLGRLAVVEIAPGESARARAIAESALAALPGDRGAADFVVVCDHGVDLGEHLRGWAAAFFLLASNADPSRDLVRRGRRIAIDATRKLPGAGRDGLPVRDYPPLVATDAETAALVDRRWGEYGFAGPAVPTRRAPA
jgi:4-hydroxy-3-polyprenylbenzoate decarboxylase